MSAEILQPVIDPASRTFAPMLLGAAIIAIVLHKCRRAPGGLRAALGTHLWKHPSSVVDLQVLIARRLLSVMGLIPLAGGAWVMAVGVATGLDHHLGQPALPIVPQSVLTVGYSIVLFVVWDLSRFVLHWLLHRIPTLWQFHQVHHSAEVLTPLTFHRVHPVESILYSLRGILTTGLLAGVAYWLFRGSAVEYTLLGVHGIGLACNALSGNLRHSHVWLRFGSRIEHWLLSPAQHQLHHSRAPEHRDINFGTWLACWDRMMNSLVLASKTPPENFGIDNPNHAPDQLVSVLLHPFQAASRSLPAFRWWAAAAGLMLAFGAQAQETSSSSSDSAGEEQDDADSDGTMIVTADNGVPRVAGSAHVIDEATLERHEYTDIHQVLTAVPGVYLRGEDGFGLRPNIGLRGGNSDRSAKITLLEDGIPLAPAPYAAPAAYYFPMPARLIGIEVIKGAAAIRHGPQTIGGAINLRTRRIPRETIAEVDTAVGLRNTWKAHGYTGTGGERWGVLAEIAHLSSDGFKVLDTGGKTGFNRQDAMLKARIGSSRDQTLFNDLELKLGYGREDSHETYLGLTQSDFDATPDRRYAASHGDRMQWQRTAESLTWRLLSGDNFDARTVVYHQHLGRAWTKLNGFSSGVNLHDLLLQDSAQGQAATYLAILKGEEDSASPDHALMRGTNDRDFHSYGVQSVVHHRSGDYSLNNELEVGVRLHGDRVTRIHTEKAHEMQSGQLVVTDGETETTLDSGTRAHALAVHLQDDLGIGMFHLLPGVRTEMVETRSGTSNQVPSEPQTRTIVLPGMGLYASVTPGLDLLAGVHRGFSPVAPGSPEEAVPETAWNYESGLRLHHNKSRFEAVGFLSDYQNLTGQCTLSGGCTDDQLDTQFNGGEATVLGVESTAGHGVPLPYELTLNLDLSYAWTEATFESSFLSQFPQFGSVTSGDHLPYVPNHQGALSVALDHRRASISAKTAGRSAMRDMAGDEDLSNEPPIPAHLQTDVAAMVHFNDHWTAYTTLTNVTGSRTVESWRPFGARPSTPFQAMVGIKAKL